MCTDRWVRHMLAMRTHTHTHRSDIARHLPHPQQCCPPPISPAAPPHPPPSPTHPQHPTISLPHPQLPHIHFIRISPAAPPHPLPSWPPPSKTSPPPAPPPPTPPPPRHCHQRHVPRQRVAVVVKRLYLAVIPRFDPGPDVEQAEGQRDRAVVVAAAGGVPAGGEPRVEIGGG